MKSKVDTELSSKLLVEKDKEEVLIPVIYNTDEYGKEIIIDIIESSSTNSSSSNLIKLNPTTVIDAVKDLRLVLSTSGKVRSVNDKVGDVVITSDDISSTDGKHSDLSEELRSLSSDLSKLFRDLEGTFDMVGE